MAGQEKAVSIFDINARAATFALVCVVMLAATIMSAPAVQAQTYTVLYTFTGGAAGATPLAGLTADAGGNLYGTTEQGSIFQPCSALNCGTVFEVMRHGSRLLTTPIYSFKGAPDGGAPTGRVIFGPDGSLYGTTMYGGTGTCISTLNGCGTVFKLQRPFSVCKSVVSPWTETILYSFASQNDGEWPQAEVAFDAEGNLYGTTSLGGTGPCSNGLDTGCGTVFKLTHNPNGSWTKTTLYSFQNGANDGAFPYAGVTIDSAGNLYGTTPGGGLQCFEQSCGTIYKLSPSGSGWAETILHFFTGGADGSDPAGGLIFDSQGNLYGAAVTNGNGGSGKVYELSPGQNGWNLTVLHSFSGDEAAGPGSKLTMDAAGNLYGSSTGGGAYTSGTIYKLAHSNGAWNYGTLHSFSSEDDGGFAPFGSVVIDAEGNVYSTASQGPYPSPDDRHGIRGHAINLPGVCSIIGRWRASDSPRPRVPWERSGFHRGTGMMVRQHSGIPKAWTLVAVTSLLVTLACGGGSSSSSEMTPPPQQFALTQLSTDKFSNPGSQHATEVEPGIFAVGPAIVTTFQVGRFFGGGASDIGFATSSDGGVSWASGLLPGITQFEGGSYAAASDPTVVYDQAHGVWMISSLAITANNDVVLVSRSPDAVTWGAPIAVSASPDADKEWITCDNTATSPFFDHCYLEWDDPTAKGLIWMSTSKDGGLTWSTAVNTAGMAQGIGGQPLVQKNGTVVVPIDNPDETAILAFTSSDGGATWNAPVTVSPITDHQVAGGLRTTPLPSAAVDAAGTVYVVWQDCRFRTGCSSNDIVMSTSSDGINWTAPVGIPIDAATSTVDHFIPSLAVDPASSSTTAGLALSYYFYPVATCTMPTCQLSVGFVSSQNGGTNWSAPTTLAGPMTLSWLPNTTSGLMVGDYFATAYSGGHAYSVFAVAQANSGTTFNQAMFVNTNPLPLLQSMRATMKADAAVTRRSDHEPRKFYDLEHEHPIPRRKK